MNSSAVSFFFDMATQWRCVSRGMTGVMEWLGIDYAAASAVLDMRYHRRSQAGLKARLMDDLRFMEAVALPIRNEAAAQ